MARAPAPWIMLPALALLATSTVAMGQAKAPPPPSKDMLDAASANLRIIAAALQAKEVDTPIKNALFGCLYRNNLAKITESTNKVLANNPGKIDRKNPTQMLMVIAGVCGYRPAGAAAPAPKR